MGNRGLNVSPRMKPALSFHHLGWRHINKSIVCFIYTHWSLAVTINMRYYLETWVALHFTLQAEWKNIPTLCLQLLITKTWKGQGDFNCTSPGAQFWLPLILCNIKYVPIWTYSKTFYITFNRNAITNREKPGSRPIQQTFLKYDIQLM